MRKPRRLQITLIPETSIMSGVKEVVLNIQREAVKERGRNLTTLRNYSLSACYWGGMNLERDFLFEVSTHLSDYERTLIRASLGTFRAYVREIKIEDLNLYFTNLQDVDIVKYKETVAFYEKGNRSTAQRYAEKEKERKPIQDHYTELSFSGLEKSLSKISSMYENRIGIPLIERKELYQCAAIINDDPSNPMCCGRSKEESVSYCTECARVYFTTAAGSMKKAYEWAKRI
jgi:hypothetical protein